MGTDSQANVRSMLKALRLTLDGRHHSGIDDARNIAKIATTLLAKKSDEQQWEISSSK